MTAKHKPKPKPKPPEPTIEKGVVAPIQVVVRAPDVFPAPPPPPPQDVLLPPVITKGIIPAPGEIQTVVRAPDVFPTNPTHAPIATIASYNERGPWIPMLASWYSTGGGGGSCGTLQDGHLHFAELGVAGDYGHGAAHGRGNMAADLGLGGQLPCGAAGWIRYKGKVTYASKADVGYGDTSKGPNADNQRRIDLADPLAHYLGFDGVGTVEFQPDFSFPGNPQSQAGVGAVQVAASQLYSSPTAGCTVTMERIDAGVDLAGSGRLKAIAACKIVSVKTSNTGWPGNWIRYVITQDGPLKGVMFFYAEGVHPIVYEGQHLKAGEGVCDIIPGWSTGVEIGVASDVDTVAWASTAAGGGYSKADSDASNASRAGIAMSNLIVALGGTAGVIEAGTVGNWPSWADKGSIPGGVSSGAIGFAPQGNMSPDVPADTVADALDASAIERQLWRALSHGANIGAGSAKSAADKATSIPYITTDPPEGY